MPAWAHWEIGFGSGLCNRAAGPCRRSRLGPGTAIMAMKMGKPTATFGQEQTFNFVEIEPYHE